MPSRIEDYALIGNCESAAMVGRNGSIDWLALPRFDSAACFAALLGGPENGRWQIAPTAEGRITRHYRQGTLVLETRSPQRLPNGMGWLYLVRGGRSRGTGQLSALPQPELRPRGAHHIRTVIRFRRGIGAKSKRDQAIIEGRGPVRYVPVRANANKWRKP